MTTRRWEFREPLKQLAGAASSLRRADTKCGCNEALYRAELKRAQLAIAEAVRRVRSLRAVTRGRARETKQEAA